jgi:hypothetical protein
VRRRRVYAADELAVYSGRRRSSPAATERRRPRWTCQGDSPWRGDGVAGGRRSEARRRRRSDPRRRGAAASSSTVQQLSAAGGNDGDGTGEVGRSSAAGRQTKTRQKREARWQRGGGAQACGCGGRGHAAAPEREFDRTR